MTRKVRPMMGDKTLRHECDICGLTFDTSEAAMRCESMHAHVEKVVNGEEVPYTITDHAEACADMLRKHLKALETGVAPEDIGPDVILLGRIMSRRT
ncbi:MAG: hypothetical protein KGL39_38400 [Patescibacteria group bacterium]|nr:hypothetical protein [Patescibacteria group bacterium]